MINILEESIEIHDQLNPLIWRDDKLIPEVRDKVMKIAEQFISVLEIQVEYADIQILGSNASYNYTQYSDLDVHIIVNYDLMDASKEIVQAMYNAERSTFNNNYDISIHGIDVELYVEDINSGTVSNGIYSVIEDRWIKHPVPLDKSVEDIDLEPELSELESKINQVLADSSLVDVKSMINSLYMLRKNSLATDGEYSKGNQLFKEIRNKGLLDMLKDKMYGLTSQELSLESKRTIPSDYDLLDTGYEASERSRAVKKYQDIGYEVKAKYVRTDTPGLKMWEIWGKKIND